jgi:hypothetical protein
VGKRARRSFWRGEREREEARPARFIPRIWRLPTPTPTPRLVSSRLAPNHFCITPRTRMGVRKPIRYHDIDCCCHFDTSTILRGRRESIKNWGRRKGIKKKKITFLFVDPTPRTAAHNHPLNSPRPVIVNKNQIRISMVVVVVVVVVGATHRDNQMFCAITCLS